MPDHDVVRLRGVVEHVFGHRFTLRTAETVVLADLKPHGADMVALRPGQEIELEGEAKPSEIKVTRLVRGMSEFLIDTKKPKQDPHNRGEIIRHPDASELIAKLEQQDYHLNSKPRWKGRHAEFLATKDGALVEIHVEFDGRVRKVKEADPLDEKWAA